MFHMHRPEGDNPNGIIIYDSLRSIGTTDSSYTGNIYTIAMEIKQYTFPKALEYIAEIIGVTEKRNIRIKLPFHGFFNKLIKDTNEPENNQKTYSEDDLPPADCLSKMFLDDNVALTVQEEFGVRLDLQEDATLIPIKDTNGKIVGCKARSNNPNCPHDKRWWAKISFAKTLNCYGYVENYKDIVAKRVVVIFEAEKSVLQCRGWGFNLALAIGGHSFSATQVRIIKSLLCDRIIIAFDKDICRDEVEYEGRKLIVDNNILKNKVQYLYDDNDVLDEKDSPSDKGFEIFQDLVKHHCYDVERIIKNE